MDMLDMAIVMDTVMGTIMDTHMNYPKVCRL